jgi:uncharacterized protein YecA (UPF0149 family)
MTKKIVEGAMNRLVVPGYKLMNTPGGMMKRTRDGRALKPHLADVVPGRNDLCDCGSGKKYKKCCGK